MENAKVADGVEEIRERNRLQAIAVERALPLSSPEKIHADRSFLLSELDRMKEERDEAVTHLRCLVGALDAPAHVWSNAKDAAVAGGEIEMHLAVAREFLQRGGR